MTYYVAMALDTHDIVVVQVSADNRLDAISQVRTAYGGWCHCVVFDQPPIDEQYWTISELEDYYD